MIEKGGVQIPKLDFSSIFIQREHIDTAHDDEDGESGQEEEEESYY